MAGKERKLPDYQKVDGHILPGAFYPYAQRETSNMKPRPTDIFINAYPKCGMTWTQQILYLMINKGSPPELGEAFRNCHFLSMNGTEGIEKIPNPRLFKMHLNYNLAPYSPEAKYIILARNPKDTLVSFYHHSCCLLYDFEDGDFNDYFDIFIKGENDFGDYFDFLESWYEHRNDPNVLFLYYENMKADHRGIVQQMAKFLGPEYEETVKDETVLNDIVKYSSIEYMKSTTNTDLDDMYDFDNEDFEKLPKAVQYFLTYMKENRRSLQLGLTLVRKGTVGDWRNLFTDDQDRRMNEKIEDRLKGTELLEFWNSIGCLKK